MIYKLCPVQMRIIVDEPCGSQANEYLSVGHGPGLREGVRESCALPLSGALEVQNVKRVTQPRRWTVPQSRHTHTHTLALHVVLVDHAVTYQSHALSSATCQRE